MIRLCPAVLVACLGPAIDSGTGSDDLDTEVRAFTSDCVTTDRFEADATIGGAAVSRAVLNFWDSGVPNGWNEEHSFRVSGAVTQPLDADPSTTDTAGPPTETLTTLSMGLDYTFTPDNVGDTAPGAGRTWLSCEGAAPFELGLVTFALRAYDTEGDLATCVAFGFDAPSVGAGIYSVAGGVPSNDTELLRCPVATF